jgi:hypothetical protein
METKNSTTDVKKLGSLYESFISEMAYGRAADAIPITTAEISDKISAAEAEGVRPISVTLVTIPQQSKTNEFYPIYKVSRMIGKIGTEYENEVNTHKVREDQPADFKTQSGWGQHISKALVTGKSGLYLMITSSTNNPIKNPSSIYVTAQGGNFRILSQAEWSKYIKPQTTNAVQSQQGLNNAVIVRKPLVANIAGLSVGGKEYVITDLDNTKQEVLKVSGV